MFLLTNKYILLSNYSPSSYMYMCTSPLMGGLVIKPFSFQQLLIVQKCWPCVQICSNYSNHSDFRAVPDTARFLDSVTCCLFLLLEAKFFATPRGEKKIGNQLKTGSLYRLSSLSLIQMVRGEGQKVSSVVNMQCAF